MSELPQPERELVHQPLARWAAERGGATAVDDGTVSLSFSRLWDAVQTSALALERGRAPATVLLGHGAGGAQRVLDFLAVVASGRCAAVSDPDWPDATRQAVVESIDHSPAHLPPPDGHTPFYIGFTSGSTGLPKGFRRHHRSWVESFRVCAQTFGPDALSRILIPGRLSHSLFLFGTLLGLWGGGGVVLQDRFSAAQLLEQLAQGDIPCLVAVPSQLLVVLELAGRRRPAPMPGVRLILISGARWMREHTPSLQALFPNARIIEFYGASETSFIAWMPADPQVPAHVVGRPFDNVQIDVREPLGPDGTGLLFVRSPMVFMDYVGHEADGTAAVRDGQWLSVRDMGRIDESGRLHLAGRQNRMIVTQGKNLFPEELESVLAQHPLVRAASVHGLPHPVRGQQVAAVVQPHTGEAPTVAQLKDWCRHRLEAFKLPRNWFVASPWPLTASGKTDHTALEQGLAGWGQQQDVPWLTPLR